MIKLIDPKRQAELEEIIVQLGATVEHLKRDVIDLKEANETLTGRYWALLRKVEVVESKKVPTGYASGGYISGGLGDIATLSQDMYNRRYSMYEEPVQTSTSLDFSEYVGIDGTVTRVAPRRHGRGIPVSSIRGHEASTVVVDDEF